MVVVVVVVVVVAVAVAVAVVAVAMVEVAVVQRWCSEGCFVYVVCIVCEKGEE